MTTAPFLTDTEDVLRSAHAQVIRARATHPSFPAPVELDLTDARIDWDEKRAPRVQASLECVAPDLGTVDLLDPRAGVRVDIEAGYVRPDGTEDTHLVADLGIRRRTATEPGSTLRLELASDEARLIDAAPAAGYTLTDSSHADAIGQLIADGVYPAPPISAAVTGDPVTVSPVTDRWSTAVDLADRLGAQVYDDGLRTWHIEPAPTLAGTPDLSITVGQAGTLTATDDTLDRDEWFNYVLLRYRWTDTAGVDQQVLGTAYVATGPYAITGPAGKRIFIDEREIPTTQADANAAAAAVLDRQLSRGTTYRLTAIAAWWLRPGMTVAVTLPGRSVQLHLVGRVQFNRDGTMDLSTRVPVVDAGGDAGAPATATTTPVGGPVEPDPEPAAAQSYTTVWTATASDTFRSSGVKRADLPGEMGQGYSSPSSINGNQRAIALFTGTASSGDHAGQSITTALTGATVSKVEVYLYANHWWSSAGGTGKVGWYNGTAMPATFTGGSPSVTVPGWRRDSGRWVNITTNALISALIAGTARGVTVGPAPSSSSEYYGIFNGATAANGKPLLRITYSK